MIQGGLVGRDVFAVLPAGAGKSICFQAPAAASTGTVVVVSPLLALMQNQVEDLVQKGVPAAFLGSSLSKKKEAFVLRRLIDCQLRVLYQSPEKLVPGRHQRQDCPEAVHQLYTRGLFQLLVVDEAL